MLFTCFYRLILFSTNPEQTYQAFGHLSFSSLSCGHSWSNHGAFQVPERSSCKVKVMNLHLVHNCPMIWQQAHSTIIH